MGGHHRVSIHRSTNWMTLKVSDSVTIKVEGNTLGDIQIIFDRNAVQCLKPQPISKAFFTNFLQMLTHYYFKGFSSIIPS